MLKKSFCFILALAAFASALSGQSFLKNEGGTTNLYVDGKPFLVLSGELHNSTSTSEAYMESIGVWDQMKNAHFNTVIASCSWDVIEPQEGRYDFSSVDHVISNARKNGLKVVMIWFASWKNGESTYTPGYIKRNPKKYELVMDEKGDYHNIISTFSKNTMNADAKAFAALMRHIKAVDTDNTVIMMQVENEMGVLNSVRDFSPAAQKAWKSQVPSDLMDYLKAHKGKLFPELEKVWSENGYKTAGTWEEVFGKSHQKDWPEYPYYTEEIFQAYHYAKYTEVVTAAGKAEHNIPMYVNNWLRQPKMVIPGSFPSGSPEPEVLDIWRAAAPSVDLSAPDVYINEYDWVLKEFTRSGNPLFIPECRGDASKALYAYGEYDALGFAPFGFDGPQEGNFFGVLPERFSELASCYGILSEMTELVLKHRGSDTMRGLFVTKDDPHPFVAMGDYVISAKAVKEGAQSGALVIRTSEDEFYIVAINAEFSFYLKDPKTKGSAMTEIIEEGVFENGVWKPGRRLNGDENKVIIKGIEAQRVVLYKSPVPTIGLSLLDNFYKQL